MTLDSTTVYVEVLPLRDNEWGSNAEVTLHRPGSPVERERLHAEHGSDKLAALVAWLEDRDITTFDVVGLETHVGPEGFSGGAVNSPRYSYTDGTWTGPAGEPLDERLGQVQVF